MTNQGFTLLSLTFVVFSLVTIAFVGGRPKPINAMSLISNAKKTMNTRSVDQKRFAEFLITTGNRDFDQLAGCLDEPCDSFSFIVFPTGLSRSTPTPPIYHKAFQSDLRVRKLYELLTRMPPEIAAAKTQSIFDDYFSQYKNKWSGETTILPERDHYSVAAAMFLCSEFSDDAAILERIDCWQEWHEDHQGKSEHFNERARILPLFLMNTYCSMLIRNGADFESVNLLIDGLKESTKISGSVRRKPLLAWDSSIGRNEIIGELTVIPSWSHLIRLKPDLYDNLNAFLRSAVASEQ